MNQVAMKIGERDIELEWPVDGKKMHIPFLWLRDNCPCDDCRVMQTTEKKFIVSSVAADIEPTFAEVLGNELKIIWPNQHQTSYRLEFLQKFSLRKRPQWSSWSATYTPIKFDYRASLDQSNIAKEMIVELAVSGAVILHNAPADKEALEKLAIRLGPMREMTFDRIHDVVFDPKGYNVAATSLKLAPHNDFSSSSWPPSIQVLHMLVNDTTGGETIIVDAFTVVEKLRADHPEYFDVLCRVPVPFRMFSEEAETYAVQPMLRCDNHGNLNHVRFSNQLMQVLDPNTPELDLFYQAYHELSSRITADSANITFRLNAGEMLILASHRVLHAREAFEPDGERHLRDAYFELENAINHLHVIERHSK